MPSNFEFLAPHFVELQKLAMEAEAQVHRSPRGACFHARFALEVATRWLYRHDKTLELPYDTSLNALLHEPSFKDNLPIRLWEKLRTIQKVGNHAAHDHRPLEVKDAHHVVKELFHFLYWLARVYAPPGTEALKVDWSPARVPRGEAVPGPSPQQLAELEKKLGQSDEMARIEAERRQMTEAELERVKAELETLKAQNQASPDTHDYDEQETRDYFIDLLLKETGWVMGSSVTVEHEVEGMPLGGGGSKTGKGRVDYVLWGEDGRPLALVEAKRSRFDPLKGQQQAKLYADCLEARYGRRPVIFCSNGYEHWIWDDLRYPPRPVQGFYKKDELQLLHHRRAHGRKLTLVQPDGAIAGRHYQLQAIQHLAEGLQQGRRKGLLVMATGTGKTRTVISLVDLLRRADQVKRVLFLADRNALLVQAKRAFQSQLPGVAVADLTQEVGATDATVVLSTYPTMLNRIDRREGGQVVFGPGHFDLVVVDEAHRSIYQKYAALFEYFDAWLVGLTATPRAEINRDTYRVFDLEPGVPTYAYELKDAVEDGFLVPPRGVTVPFRFLQQGIRYADLSPEAREEYERKLRDEETGDLPPSVDAEALNRWLFNNDTVDQALKLLMERGHRVEDGDRLGKTIVFARNHEHALFVQKRFDLHYPHFKGQFARVIDSHDDYAQSLLDAFSDPEKQPGIAISVDMLDTGVDVPEVVNLVFFKPVRSRVKFNQMIGRGTRLCPDLHGPGRHKEDFLVFDLCSNFEYFGQDLALTDPPLPEALGTRIFKARLGLVGRLPAAGAGSALRKGLLDALHAQVSSMNLDNFLVRRARRTVEVFQDRERWEALSSEDQEQLSQEVAALPDGLPPEKLEAKQFDLLCYRLMLSRMQGDKAFTGYRDKVRELCGQLSELSTIPMVKAQMGLIHAAQEDEFWADGTLSEVEDLRVRLRGLIQFIDRRSRPVVYTDLPDPLQPDLIREAEVPIYPTGLSLGQYRKKVEALIQANEHNLVIAKLKRNQALTPTDLSSLEAMLFDPIAVGTREDFEKAYGRGLSLPLFIRRLVGLDRAAAKDAFARYLLEGRFTAAQTRFIETVIDFLTRNGVMDPDLLWEPPFTDLHPAGLDGVFPDEDADRIISIVCGFNETVGARFSEAG